MSTSAIITKLTKKVSLSTQLVYLLFYAKLHQTSIMSLSFRFPFYPLVFSCSILATFLKSRGGGKRPTKMLTKRAKKMETIDERYHFRYSFYRFL